VQNAIVARGYVTTRVLAAPQDIKEGQLTLTLIPGRIHSIRFTDDSGKRATEFNAMPAAPGDILNLRDIEQGLENFKRVPTADANIQITPAEGKDVKPGESDLVIAWKQERPFRLNLSIDNSGSQYTGRYLGTATVSWDDPLALNDLLYLSLSHDLGGGESGSHGTHSYTAHYEVPLGYWLLGLTASSYRYHQSVAGANGPIIYAGTSENQEAALSRVMQRDSRGKTTLSVKAWRQASRNFIDDTEVLVQRRVEGGWELDLGRTQSIGQASLDGQIGYKKGTGAFGALTAPEQQFGEGTGRFELISADLKLNAPFQWGSQRIRYVSEWRGQYNRTPLVLLDRFAIGGMYTVRGFNGDQQLIADRGWLWRNELAFAIGQSGQEIYGALDHGQVGGASAASLVGTSLTGAALGWRGSLAKPKLQYDLFVGAPVKKPRFMDASSWVVGFTLNWSI